MIQRKKDKEGFVSIKHCADAAATQGLKDYEKNKFKKRINYSIQ